MWIDTATALPKHEGTYRVTDEHKTTTTRLQFANGRWWGTSWLKNVEVIDICFWQRVRKP